MTSRPTSFAVALLAVAVSAAVPHAGEPTGTTTAARGEPITLAGHEGGVLAAVFSPDGKQVATAGWDRVVKVWDLANPGRPRVLGQHVTRVMSLAYSPDGKMVAAVAGDQTHGEVKLWDVVGEKEFWSSDTSPAAANCVAFSPDGKTVAVALGSTHAVKLLGARDGREVGQLAVRSGAMLAVAYSPDGSMIATGGSDGVARLWMVESRSEYASLSWGPSGQSVAFTVAFTPDGRSVVVGCDDGRVRFWDVRTAQPQAELVAHKTLISRLAFSPDGRHLATAGFRDPACNALVWSDRWLAGGQPLVGHKGYVAGLAFSPAGDRLVTASADGTAKVWTLAADAPKPAK
ncbi:MAG: WD40 repeat domain-containing protein [Gemmataceae bacterium]|nr:WD40 repeat domain-containing protein [Gemmataceae bacterium]